MRKVLLLLTLSVIHCGSKTVPPQEAREFVKALDTIAKHIQDKDDQTRLLYGACGEIASCAGGCARALQASAQSSTDSAQRGVIMADCFADFKKEHASQGTPVNVWFRKYVAAYLNRAKGSLNAEEQKRLEDARAALKLN